jgi:hypothetical protein
MPDMPLDVVDGLAGVALVPAPIEVLGDHPELDDQVVGQVIGVGLAALFGQRRRRAASSVPVTIRASEPPMKVRRSVGNGCN